MRKHNLHLNVSNVNTNIWEIKKTDVNQNAFLPLRGMSAAALVLSVRSSWVLKLCLRIQTSRTAPAAASLYPINCPGRTSPPPDQRVCLPHSGMWIYSFQSVCARLREGVYSHTVFSWSAFICDWSWQVWFSQNSVQSCTDLLQRRDHKAPPNGATNTLTRPSKVFERYYTVDQWNVTIHLLKYCNWVHFVFTWVFPFCATWYFYSTTFQILYSLLHCICLTAFVSDYNFSYTCCPVKITCQISYIAKFGEFGHHLTFGRTKCFSGLTNRWQY